MLETKEEENKLCSEKNEMGKLHSLLKKIQCSVLFIRTEIFSVSNIFDKQCFMTRNFTSFCYGLSSCPSEDKVGCCEILRFSAKKEHFRVTVNDKAIQRDLESIICI